MTVYKCNGCSHTCVSLGRPRGCEACGAGAMFLEAEAEVSLPGCEKVARDRAEAYGVAQAAAMSERLRSARGDVSRTAGRLERESPLFFGSGDNPGLF